VILQLIFSISADPNPNRPTPSTTPATALLYAATS
jgi:hypothetical protein